MKVLVTSSTGLTGKAVVKALATKNIEVRAMIHSAEKADVMIKNGATETFKGDIGSAYDLEKAMEGIDVMYYIAPTAREDESEIGIMAVEIAHKSGLGKFVYQSVLHSIEPTLPHHRQKLTVEQFLVSSGLKYSIVQPAPFMQNLLNSKDTLNASNILAQKFFIDSSSTNKINLIDVKDFGECVTKVLLENRFLFSSLELCGPENISVFKLLETLEILIGHRPTLKFLSDDELRNGMKAHGATNYAISTLLKMFDHYNKNDFCGSSFVATSILERPLITLKECLKRELDGED